MKTSPTRWRCRLARIWINPALHEANDRGLGARHVATCPECQQYWAAERDLTATLRGSARPLRVSAPEDFDRRVLQALARTPHAPAPARPVGPIIFALGCAAAVIALVVVSRWPTRLPSTATPPVAVTPPRSAPATATTLVVDPFPALNASVTAVLEKEPLQKEAVSMYADARSAVRFLALNFLPPSSPTPANGRAPRDDG